MKNVQKIMTGVVMIGQLGFSLITPPLVLIFLAHLLMTRCGWGLWVMVTAIVVGLGAGISSVVTTAKHLSDRDRKNAPKKGISFNDHV